MSEFLEERKCNENDPREQWAFHRNLTVWGRADGNSMGLRAHLVSFLQPDREMEGPVVLHRALVRACINRV